MQMFARGIFLFTLIFYISVVNCQEDRRRYPCYSDGDVITAITSNQSPGVVPLDAHVQVEMRIDRLKSLHIDTQQLELSLYVSEQWSDNSLRFHHMNPCSNSNVTTSNEILSKLWTPKMTFVNSIETKTAQSSNRGDLVMIFPNGTIWRNYKVDLIVPCEADFSKFPAHVQQCNLTYSSSFHDAQRVNVTWSEDPVLQQSDTVRLQNFNLINMERIRRRTILRQGDWIELTLHLEFRGRIGWYLKFIYIPSFMLVGISWITFTLGLAIAARVVLGCSTFVGLLLIYLFAVKEMPRTSYITALDWWLGICLLYVFLSLMELALFALISRCLCNNYNSSCHHTENEIAKPTSPHSRPVKKRNVATIVDIIFGILFPLTFVIFFIFYCVDAPWH